VTERHKIRLDHSSVTTATPATPSPGRPHSRHKLPGQRGRPVTAPPKRHQLVLGLQCGRPVAQCGCLGDGGCYRLRERDLVEGLEAYGLVLLCIIEGGGCVWHNKLIGWRQSGGTAQAKPRAQPPKDPCKKGIAAHTSQPRTRGLDEPRGIPLPLPQQPSRHHGQVMQICSVLEQRGTRRQEVLKEGGQVGGLLQDGGVVQGQVPQPVGPTVAVYVQHECIPGCVGHLILLGGWGVGLGVVRVMSTRRSQDQTALHAQ